MPVVTTYEYWWWDGGEYSLGGWRMDRIENGKRSHHRFAGDIESEIKRLRAAGFTVNEFQTPGAPRLFQSAVGPRARRKTFAERYNAIGVRS